MQMEVNKLVIFLRGCARFVMIQKSAFDVQLMLKGAESNAVLDIVTE